MADGFERGFLCSLLLLGCCLAVDNVCLLTGSIKHVSSHNKNLPYAKETGIVTIIEPDYFAIYL